MQKDPKVGFEPRTFLLQDNSATNFTHSLKYFYTASSGLKSFPEFVTVGMVDDQPFSYYDSVIRRETPKQDWMAKNEGPEYWETQTQTSIVFANGSNVGSIYSSELPSVSVLRKSSSSPVSCHATGFYPNGAEMLWRKDGEEIHVGVEKGEILPNNDGTFQMSVDLKPSSENPEEWTKYECVFQLSGVNEDIVHRLEKTKIRSNESNDNMMIIIVVAAVAVLGLIGVVGFIIYKKKNGERRIFYLSFPVFSILTFTQ
uniref:Ig-like domain-containing protein n=1 Tax=Fundulus heteroclitus TaxID=8078 RepID=A0A3Q2T661_FUNHE